MSIFEYNGKVMNFLTTFWDIVWIGFLWLICSLPLVTIGAASTAAYYAMSKCVRRSTGHVTKEFFRAFKNNFRQSFFLTLIYLLIGIVLAADGYFFYLAKSDFALAGRLLSCLLILIYLCATTYAFAMLSRFEVHTFSLLKYSFSLTIANIPQTLALMIFWIAGVVLTYWFWWVILLLPGFKCFLDSLMLEPLLKKYEESSGKEEQNSEKNHIDNCEDN